jgi:hypothetical protein
MPAGASTTALLLLCVVRSDVSASAIGTITPDPGSPILLVKCDSEDPRQLWATASKQHHGRNLTQLVLSADGGALAMACTTGYDAGGVAGRCHQWDAGDTSYSSGTTFSLNRSFAGGQFMIEAPSYDDSDTAVLPEFAAGGPAAGRAAQGSCKAIGCGTPYSKSLPCQCFHGCLRYHACCADYVSVCPQPPPYVLAPNGSAVAGVAAVIANLGTVSPGPASALWTHAGDNNPVMHAQSGLCLSQAAAAATKPFNLTMYHVNQGTFSGVTNMDLADAGGDALFDFRIPSQLWSCTRQAGKSQFPSQCDNPEEFAPPTQLVVTKVVVTVLAGSVGRYSRCNLCPDDGVTPFAPVDPSDPAGSCPAGGSCTCTKGSYSCWPNTKAGWYGPVGSLDPGKAFYVHHSAPNFAPNPYDGETSQRWESNLANRTGGLWYSALQEGEGKYWRLAETVKKVNASCMSVHWSQRLEKNAVGCFKGCPQPTNSSSMCYIECFFEGLLGPDGGRMTPAVGGLTGEEIIGLWLDAFAACPALGDLKDLKAMGGGGGGGGDSTALSAAVDQPGSMTVTAEMPAGRADARVPCANLAPAGFSLIPGACMGAPSKCRGDSCDCTANVQLASGSNCHNKTGGCFEDAQRACVANKECKSFAILGAPCTKYKSQQWQTYSVGSANAVNNTPWTTFARHSDTPVEPPPPPLRPHSAAGATVEAALAVHR